MTPSIHVTFKSRFGLCNRLRGLAGYYALSKSLNWELFYTWEADPSCPGLIDEVFLPIPGALFVAQLPKPSDHRYLRFGPATHPLRLATGAHLSGPWPGAGG